MQDSWYSKKDNQTQLPLSLMEKISDQVWLIRKAIIDIASENIFSP
jgi:hypothetical protein